MAPIGYLAHCAIRYNRALGAHAGLNRSFVVSATTFAIACAIAGAATLLAAEIASDPMESDLGGGDSAALKCTSGNGIDWQIVREDMWVAVLSREIGSLKDRLLRLGEASSNDQCAAGVATVRALLAVTRVREVGEAIATEGLADDDPSAAAADMRQFGANLVDLLEAGFPLFGVLAWLSDEIERSVIPNISESEYGKMGYSVAWAPRWSRAAAEVASCNTRHARIFRMDLFDFLLEDGRPFPSLPAVDYLGKPWSTHCPVGSSAGVLALAIAASPMAGLLPNTTTALMPGLTEDEAVVRRRHVWDLVRMAEEMLLSVSVGAQDVRGELPMLFGRAWPIWSLLHRLQCLLTGHF